VTALNSVDFPTFGSPTIPALSIGAQNKCDVTAPQSEARI